jgi:hypothetical protein
MTDPTSDPKPGPGDDAGPDPLQAFLAHLGEAFAAGRVCLSVAADEAMLALDRLMFRLFLTLFVVALAFVMACLGGYHLVVGSLLGLESLLGSRCGAALVVGASCLLTAVALIAWLLRHFRQIRLAKLRLRYPGIT